jgi:sugar phosphate isomerase/epimerase
MAQLRPGSSFSGDLGSRLSCADSAFPRLSHQAALAVIADLGIPAVDICVFAGYEHNPPEAVLADPQGAADAVLRGLERASLTAADVFVIPDTSFEELAVNHPDAEVRRESLSLFRSAVEFAHRLDAPGITVLPGTAFGGVDPDESLRLAAAGLQQRAEIAAEVGVRLAIEPHYQSIVESPPKALELLRQAPDVALALDYSHFVFQGIAQDEVDSLIPRARHLHLRQAAPGTIQTRVAEGAIDFPRMLGRLEAAGYTGFLALEYQHEEWLSCNRVDCISETAELRELVLGYRSQR